MATSDGWLFQRLQCIHWLWIRIKMKMRMRMRMRMKMKVLLIGSSGNGIDKLFFIWFAFEFSCQNFLHYNLHVHRSLSPWTQWKPHFTYYPLFPSMDLWHNNQLLSSLYYSVQNLNNTFCRQYRPIYVWVCILCTLLLRLIEFPSANVHLANVSLMFFMSMKFFVCAEHKSVSISFRK